MYPVIFMALTPYFINHLGEEMFGLWMFLNSLLIAFQVFNFGLAPATMKYVAQYRHSHQHINVRAVINTNLSLSLLLMILSFAVGFYIAGAVRYANLFNFPLPLKMFAASAIQITSFIIGLKFTEQIFLSAFKGFERYDIYAMLNAVIRFGALAINLVQVTYHQSLLVMLFTNLCITVSMLIVQYIVLKKMFPQFKIALIFRKTLIAENIRFGLFTWLQSLAVIVVFQIDRYFVITYGGLEKLGYYVLTATILISMHSCLSACATWLIPKIVRSKDAPAESRRLYISMRAFITMLSLSGICLFYMLHQPLFTVWMGTEKFSQIKTYMKLFAVFELFYMLIIVPPLYLNYSGREKAGTLLIYSVSLLNIVGIVSGFFYWNSIEGLLYGLIASAIISAVVVYVYMSVSILHGNLFYETFVFVGLAGVGGALIFFSNLALQLSIFVLILGLCYLIFIKLEGFRLNRLFD